MVPDPVDLFLANPTPLNFLSAARTIFLSSIVVGLYIGIGIIGALLGLLAVLSVPCLLAGFLIIIYRGIARFIQKYERRVVPVLNMAKQKL